MVTCSFHREAPRQSDRPTLVEGLPGHGLVASIAVDQLTTQLDLEPYGGIRSTDVPPILSFRDGRVRDTVRVYSGADPDLLTLHSDVPLAPAAYRPFSKCVLSDLANEIERGIFLAAAPAKSEEQHGAVVGVATDDAVESALVDANIDLAERDGLVGGVTGALVDECYVSGIPAALLLVRADPHVPDPEAARRLIENALEPLLDIDISTSELTKQAEQIKAKKQQIAEQVQAAQETPETDQSVHMYQ